MNVASLCDFCSSESNLVCGKCKSASYCSVEHQTLLWKYHKKVCGYSLDTTFRQPDLEMAEFVHFRESLEAYPDDQGDKLLEFLETLVKPGAPEEIKFLMDCVLVNLVLNYFEASKRNRWLGFIRQKIQFKISRSEEEFRAFREHSYHLLPWYQVADVELGIEPSERNPEFVRLYFLRACLQEIDDKDRTAVTFTHYKRLVLRMDKTLGEWNEGSNSKQAKKQYLTRLTLWRNFLEARHFSSTKGLSKEEEMDIVWTLARGIGVKPREEM